MTNTDNESLDHVTRLITSIWLPAALLGSLLLLTLIMEFVLAWQSHQQLLPVKMHIEQIVKLQGANLELQRELVESLHGEGKFDLNERRKLAIVIKSILEAHGLLSQDSPSLITSAHEALVDISRHPKEALILALTQTRKAINLESREHQRLVEKINRATALQLRIGAFALVLIPMVAILLIYLLRRRILRPLERLGYLMTLLAQSDYTQAPFTSVDPMLRSLTQNYNAMVSRMAIKETVHTAREQSLETQVDIATRALLDQQRRLDNTERLATVGAMMARIAHEMRNPLAGIKLACANLRTELAATPSQADYVARMDIIAVEIDRIISVLNSILDGSRHQPEPVADVNIAEAVTDLMVLARYQIPESITLTSDIVEDLYCRLPDALMRQALLNLLLNAAQAIGDASGNINVHAHIQDHILHLIVTDDGPGFPPEILATAIRSFVSHRPQGTGLGLSMVQRFAHAQGGDVTLSNRKPQGACITLKLPCEDHDV